MGWTIRREQQEVRWRRCKYIYYDLKEVNTKQQSENTQTDGKNKPPNYGFRRRHKKLLALSSEANPSIRLQVMFFPLLLLLSSLVLLLIVVSPPHSTLVRGEQQLYYYASLPKIGHIRGLRIDGSPQPEAHGGASAGGGSVKKPVVAFLGIPYAAPPTGLLRFMPPGAANSATNQRPMEQGLLMPAGQQRVGIRPHAHFGRQCVHLPDWLEPQTNSTTTERKTTSGKEVNTAADNLAAIRDRQSEDCLNLNAFVPLNDFNKQTPMGQQQQQQQQIKSALSFNYPSPQPNQQAQFNPISSIPQHSSSSQPFDGSNQKANDYNNSINHQGEYHQNQGNFLAHIVF